MTPEQFRAVDALFRAVRELPVEQRDAFLARADAAEETRAAVRTLLFHDADPAPYLRTPAIAAGLQFHAAAEPPPDAGLPARIGSYRVLNVLGEGGFGVVYLAEQERPRRTVAVKVLRAAVAATTLLRRFEVEAQVLARLQHPRIAQVFEAGAAPGPHGLQAFIAMEYVNGLPLDRYVRERNLPVPARLALFADVCEAVQYAHQMGVIHRDLKPANILVDAHGCPKILDFGVARTTDVDAPATTLLTQPGQMVGTLAYMSPEQLGGDPRDVDTRADVYALGVMLFQILSGRLPIDVRSAVLPEAVRRIHDELPPRLGTLDRGLRGDIETITAKALEKDRTRRYQSAAELARDLRRHLADEPIEAKRDSTLYVLGKTLRRYRGLVTASVGFSLLLGVFAVLSLIQAEQSRRLAVREHAANAEAQEASRRADAEAAKLRDALYFNNIGFAEAALAGNDLARVNRLLAACPPARRNWEWYYLARLADRSLDSRRWGTTDTIAAALTADGNALLLAQSDGVLTLVDVRAKAVRWQRPPEQFIPVATLNAAGTLVAVGDLAGGVTVRDAADGAVLRAWQHDPEGTSPAAERQIRTVAFSSAADRLATGGRDRCIRIWNVATGELVHTLTGHAGDVICLAFTSDGARLISGAGDGDVWIWNLETGVVVHRLTGHRMPVSAVAVSPDGMLVASGGNDADVRIWDATTGACRDTLHGHLYSVRTLAFTPDGRGLLSGGAESSVKLWSLPGGDLLCTLRGHAHQVQYVAVCPDSGQLLSVDRDGVVKWWSPTPEPETPALHTRHGQVLTVAYSPDGGLLAAAGNDDTISLWDPRTAQPLGELRGHAGMVVRLAFTPDARQLVSGGQDRVIRIWDLATRRVVRELTGHAATIFCVSVAADGTWLASADGHGVIRTWSLTTGEPRLSWSAHEGVAYTAIISPDGAYIASGGADKLLQLRDATDGRLLGEWRGHTRLIYDLAFSPDGRRLATVSEDGQLRVWDVPGGRPVYACDAHRGAALGVCYSPDGARIVTGGADNAVRLWEAAAGTEILAMFQHDRLVQKVAFRPDGWQIASSSDDGTIRLWTAVTAAETPQAELTSR